MKFSYFPDDEILCIHLLDVPSIEGFDVTGDVIAHATADGRFTYLEIHHATERTTLESLAKSDPDIKWLVEKWHSDPHIQIDVDQISGRGQQRSGLITCAYLQDADMLDIRFNEAESGDDVRVAPGILLGLDETRRICGLNIAFASDKVSDFDWTGMQPSVEWLTHIESPNLVPVT